MSLPIGAFQFDPTTHERPVCQPDYQPNILNLLIKLAKEKRLSQVVEIILDEAMLLTQAQGGTFYLVREEKTASFLEFALVKNKKLNIFVNHLDSAAQGFTALKAIPLKLESGGYNIRNVATYASLTRTTVNIDNVYQTERFDFSGTRAFDQKTGYLSQSFLTIPLTNAKRDVVGVLQLINAAHPESQEIIAFSQDKESIVTGLAAYAAIALNNHILSQEYKSLWDSFIQCIAQLIDQKSKHTANHCQRVPYIMELFVEAGCKDQDFLHSFDLSEDEKYEIKVASWLHDCGKLATPDMVLNKATKLEKMIDGLEVIELKIQLILQNESLSIFSRKITHPIFCIKALLAYQEKSIFLLKAIEKLKVINLGGEFLSEADKIFIKSLAQFSYETLTGEKKLLLTQSEVDVLCIERGTLSHKERGIINKHIDVTITLLESLPFPKRLKKVPEIAGGHHEKIDGTGYPKKLTGNQMSIPAKMMAISDIFEALTSADRPYKEPMKMSQALGILKKMKDHRHIDADLYQVFIRQGVWMQYAEQFMQKEQMDVIDASIYL